MNVMDMYTHTHAIHDTQHFFSTAKAKWKVSIFMWVNKTFFSPTHQHSARRSRCTRAQQIFRIFDGVYFIESFSSSNICEFSDFFFFLCLLSSRISEFQCFFQRLAKAKPFFLILIEISRKRLGTEFFKLPSMQLLLAFFGL